MCGIAGIVDCGGDIDTNRAAEVLRKMTASISHRGPDGVGYYDDHNAHLGHARLSIIDLESGAQPISNEDGSIVLVCNGEIYGYENLRTQLEKQHEFRTQSDSEVILHLFEDHQVSFAERLNGMYAIALYEVEKKRLSLCVDDRGIKPLYYAQQDNTIIFGSELRAVVIGMASLDWDIEADIAALRGYLQLGWVPFPSTAIKSVSKLRPGEMIQWEQGRTVQARPESSIPEPPEQTPSKVELLEQTLEAAITRQMVADVPVGFFLSGGIDSSLLVALAARRHKDIRTFTVKFEGGGEARLVDESDIARQVAGVIGTDHREFVLDESVLQENLMSALSALDEPIADVACLPLLLISRLARDEVKVCLTGDGGDELFGGYTRHYLWKYKNWVNGSTALRAIVGGAIRALPKKPRSGKSDLLRKLSTGLDLLIDPNFVKGPFSGKYSSYLPPEFDSEHFLVETVDDELDQLLIEINQPLAGQLLAKTDRMSMRCGLEIRVPYLDREVVRISQLFSFQEKSKLGKSKIPLRNVLDGLVPSHIVNQRKRGFRVPISSWFRTDLSSSLESELFRNRSIPDELITESSLRRLFDLHVSGQEEHSIRLWSALVLNTWFHSVADWVATARSDGAMEKCAS